MPHDEIRAPSAEVIEVGVGELAIAEHPDRLMTPALGSCVGVAIYDPVGKRGGMAHVMLPAPFGANLPGSKMRFASVAVPELVRLLQEAGSPKFRLLAKIAGGGAMFHGEGQIANVGSRNVDAVRSQLDSLGIALAAEDVGAGHARTIELHLDTGMLTVRSYQYGVLKL